jgi:hypothetical protein
LKPNQSPSFHHFSLLIFESCLFLPFWKTLFQQKTLSLQSIGFGVQKKTNNDGSSQLIRLEIVVQYLREVNPNQAYQEYPIVCEGIGENRDDIGNESGTGADDASVYADRCGEEVEEGLKVIAHLWAKLWTIA